MKIWNLGRGESSKYRQNHVELKLTFNIYIFKFITFSCFTIHLTLPIDTIMKRHQTIIQYSDIRAVVSFTDLKIKSPLRQRQESENMVESETWMRPLKSDNSLEDAKMICGSWVKWVSFFTINMIIFTKQGTWLPHLEEGGGWITQIRLRD